MDDYALYVLNNIQNAKCGNILKISDTIISENSVDSFIDSLYNCIEKSSISHDNKILIFKIVVNAQKRLVGCNSAGRQMIVDKMITSIWKTLHKEAQQ